MSILFSFIIIWSKYIENIKGKSFFFKAKKMDGSVIKSLCYCAFVDDSGSVPPHLGAHSCLWLQLQEIEHCLLAPTVPANCIDMWAGKHSDT